MIIALLDSFLPTTIMVLFILNDLLIRKKTKILLLNSQPKSASNNGQKCPDLVIIIRSRDELPFAKDPDGRAMVACKICRT